MKTRRQTQTRGRSSKPRKKTTSNRRVNSTISKLRREIIQNGVGKKKRKRQVGGSIPWVVDWKRASKVMKDVVKNGFKKVDYAKARNAVEGYKAEYRASGLSDDYEDWARKKVILKEILCVLLCRSVIYKLSSVDLLSEHRKEISKWLDEDVNEQVRCWSMLLWIVFWTVL